ncbi:MAG TPA: HAMP domain-containing sensor histidine kinase [Candidatus Saccharimonadales bacterium]|nr:HAMP domain-containing sensor histidine kinase [Candidatus Saccharimonadales bacterium]
MGSIHRPSLKLAGLYLAVMMTISLFFSLNVYQLSVQEFDRGLRGPGHGMGSGGPLDQALPDVLRQQITDERQQLYDEAKQRVVNRLVITNIVILVGGGILCYYLARRTLQPIEEAHQSQSRFTADASHELRTPIAVMQTEIEVALMNPKLTLADAKKQLTSNLEELARLTALSEGLLRLARLEDNDLHKSPVQLGTALQRAVERVLPQAEAKQMLIKTPKNIDGVVIGDQDSLIEALVTILDNATKYGSVKSQITVTFAKEKHRAVLAIADQGTGIKATELPHIFDRFYRADSARSQQSVGGYGLGLAIAKSIVVAHGGTIDVVSRLGKGTIFTVKLPLQS